MLQIYYVRFMIFVLPVLIGLLFGIFLWKVKITKYLTGLFLLACTIQWCVLANINTHGSEGPGLISLMCSLAALSFLVVEVIKLIVKGAKRRSAK